MPKTKTGREMTTSGDGSHASGPDEARPRLTTSGRPRGPPTPSVSAASYSSRVRPGVVLTSVTEVRSS